MTGFTITRLIYNWRHEGNLTGGVTQAYEEAIVGEDRVVEIREHMAVGPGDAWYYDILYSDESIVRVFHPDKVSFIKDSPTYSP